MKLVVEADDTETRAAIGRRKSRIPIEVIVAPDAGPRTKPKALNVALPFARGSFTVIYDAEDRPDAGQLRSALQAFAAAGNDLACVQASLCIDNTSDSWLAGLFTAEYAGQFDVFMPGISALRCPCRSAAHPIIFVRQRCESSAAGTPITSPRTRISACGFAASATAPP